MRRLTLILALLLFSGHTYGQGLQVSYDEGWEVQVSQGDVAASQSGILAEVNRHSDYSEDDETSVREFRPVRFWTGVGVMGGANAIGMYLLADMWYSQYDTIPWTWYSDNPNTPEGRGWIDDFPDWMQQDQLGHLLASWHLARNVGSYGQWSGLSDGWAGVFGGVASAAFMTQIEIFDGWSAHYGASRADLAFNTLGATIGGLQTAYPSLNAVTMKYSYHQSDSEHFDENLPLLGNVVGDYQGDSYWLVVRPNRLLPERMAEHWPNWLALSVGHSGDGLDHPQSGHGSRPEHQRQIYLSLDLDWTEAIDLPEPWQRIANAISFIRIPMPAIQLTPQTDFYWIYY